MPTFISNSGIHSIGNDDYEFTGGHGKTYIFHDSQGYNRNRPFTLANLGDLDAKHPHSMTAKYNFFIQDFAKATTSGVKIVAGSQSTAASVGKHQVETGTYSGHLTTITRTSTSETGGVIAFDPVTATDAHFQAGGLATKDT